MDDVTNCRSCEAPIVWVVTEKGKKMPIDAKPHPRGRFVKVSSQASEYGMVAIVHALRKGETAPSERYSSHFATCPERQEWRQ